MNCTKYFAYGLFDFLKIFFCYTYIDRLSSKVMNVFIFFHSLFDNHITNMKINHLAL